MRQNDGSEILEPNDPRASGIGLIQVSPNDDRQSVITAIATQATMGRAQIVLDLPAQNKSFKTDIDFEGLHRMANEMDAGLLLVVPKKSKIASFARKEGFALFYSMEELVDSEFPPIEPEELEAPLYAASDEIESSPDQEEEDESDHVVFFPLNPQPPATLPAEPPVSTTPLQDGEPASPQPALDPDPETLISTAPLQRLEPADVPGVITFPHVQDAETEDGSQATEAEPDRQQSMVVMGNQPYASQALVPSTASGVPTVYQDANGLAYNAPGRRRSWKSGLITAIVVIILLGLLVLLYRPVLDLIFPPAATVTITPSSQTLRHIYPITAVPGAAIATQNQVDARTLYANSSTQSKTVNATGQGNMPGRAASGTLTFYNVSTSSQEVAAGTVIIDRQGIAVVNDDPLTLPAYNPLRNAVPVLDSAHTINEGSQQNIPAADFNKALCCGSSIYVSNTTAFTGGQDAHSYTYVQQSDIDTVAATLETSLAQQATATLMAQIRSNEHLVSAPSCQQQVQSDHQAGDQVSTLTVSIVVNCLGEVYDYQGAQALAAQELSLAASQNPGSTYLPTGHITTQIVQAVPDNQGNVLLMVSAQGVWVYEFTNSQRAALARLVAGKSRENALAALRGQLGVSGAVIALNNAAGENTLPGNTSSITISVAAVPGLS
jgi:hypothetical protein